MNTTTTPTTLPAASWTRHRPSGEWVLVAPAGLRPGTQVLVTKQSGETQVKTVGQSYANRAPWDTALAFYAVQAEPRPAQTTDAPAIPAGRYAVPSKTGNNDLDFYRVDVPTEGKWKGYTFVRRVIGGQGDITIRGAEAKDALRRIAEAGVRKALATYGHAIGRCGLCGRELTDEQSRAEGIGPVCAGRLAA